MNSTTAQQSVTAYAEDGFVILRGETAEDDGPGFHEWELSIDDARVLADAVLEAILKVVRH
jgi:hypothetical protein